MKTIAIAGAGTMGAGMAQVAASSGYNVILFDVAEASLEKAIISIRQSLDKLIELNKTTKEKADETISRIMTTSELNQVKADLIIEAIIEKLEPKVQLFQDLIKINQENTLFASNTSSIPISLIASKLSCPERFIGIHFFNPATIMKLVEIITGAKTNDDTKNKAIEFVKSIGKTGVIAKDSPGFIVNRVARLYYVESLKILEEGIAEVSEIDNLLESSGFKMGPFKLMDLIGVDTNYSVTESQFQLFNYEPRFRPSRIQKQKVDAGMWGRKTKSGFYQYE